MDHGITPMPEPFRMSSMRVNLTVASATVALTDDRYGNRVEVLALTCQVMVASYYNPEGTYVSFTRCAQHIIIRC